MSGARSKDFSNLTFSETINYYNELRMVLYDQLKQEYPIFSYNPIIFSDAIQADSWEGDGRNEWSWQKAYEIYRGNSNFKRFDLCIKQGVHVSGLTYGMPTKTKTKLKIDIIESTPFSEHKNNHKIFEIISTAAQYYAHLLGADEVRIMNPLNQDLTKYYCSFGYEHIVPTKKKFSSYCSMKREV
jgi:hypothetical protein